MKNRKSAPRKESVVEMLVEVDEINRFFRGEVLVPSSIKRDKIFYFNVTSNGRTYKEWIKHFESKKIGSIINESIFEDFIPTKDVTYKVAIFRGDYFSKNKRWTSIIREEANKRNFVTPNLEIALLIRDMFTDIEIEKLGLSYILTMHEPCKEGILIGTNHGAGDSWLFGHTDMGRWSRAYGFVFLCKKVCQIE